MRRLLTLSDVVDWRLCVGCGACVPACKRGGVRMVHVESEGFRPVFTDPSCAECQDCLAVCPGAQVDGDRLIGVLPKVTRPDQEFGPTLEIWEGWASDPEVRRRGSSGGVLSALSLYCVERGDFDGVIHAGMDPSAPWMNTNYVSRDRADVLAKAGSRYAPSAPCAALGQLRAEGGPLVFIGKPCDTAAVGALVQRDPEIASRVGVVLTFFCAGTPSTRGTLDLIAQVGADRARVREVHYRGDGWPGAFRIATDDDAPAKRLSYRESWGRLTAYRPLRCNLCPDGLGRVADIACGDAWHHYDDSGDPGRSLILVRTERGRSLLRAAVQAGYITVTPATGEDVLRAQPLLERRRTLFGRLLAFQLLGVPIPRFRGFSLRASWLTSGPAHQLRSLGGTLRRILRRRWYRRRRELGLEPEAERS